MILLVENEGMSSMWIYLACCSSGEDGFHHDSCASTSNDAKTKSLPIIGQLYHLYMTPLKLQNRGDGGGKDICFDYTLNNS